MTSFAQFNNFEPHEAKMSESSLLSPPSSLEIIWQQHRTGILFVAVVLTLTVIFFGVLILLKWLEVQRRRQEMQPHLQEPQLFSRGSSTAEDADGADDVERGGLLDVDAATKPGHRWFFFIVADGGRLIVKLADVVRGAISRPIRGSKQGEVVAVDLAGDDGDK